MDQQRHIDLVRRKPRKGIAKAPAEPSNNREFIPSSLVPISAHEDLIEYLLGILGRPEVSHMGIVMSINLDYGSFVAENVSKDVHLGLYCLKKSIFESVLSLEKRSFLPIKTIFE